MAEAVERAYWLERDTLVVRGADARTWLDGLLTCSVAALQVGVAAYGLLLTKQGKIITDAWLAFTAGGELLVGVAPGRGDTVQALLDRYLVMEDAELARPATPLSWRLAEASFAPLPSSGEVAAGVAQLAQSRFAVQVTTLASHELPRASGLLAAHGFGAFGVDFTEHDNPHEASLDRVAVSWTKGCYLGQEVVCMQDMRGKVKRRLTGLLADDALLEQHAQASLSGPVSVLGADGSEVGRVTSAHRTPGGALLLASVASAALDAPASLRVLGHVVRPGLAAAAS
jgi:folate-binding protein YgfZ